MDVREKLVYLVKNALRAYGKDLGKIVEPYEFIADFLIHSGVTVQKWISVDDRLPTQEDAPTEYVFTAYKNQNCYDVEIALWDTVIAYPDMYDYWMALPLPQPPKGE